MKITLGLGWSILYIKSVVLSVLTFVLCLSMPPCRVHLFSPCQTNPCALFLCGICCFMRLYYAYFLRLVISTVFSRASHLLSLLQLSCECRYCHPSSVVVM